MKRNKSDLDKWEAAAEEYNILQGKYGDFFRKNITDPAIIKKLGDITGKKILDAGCGNGHLTAKLANLGAVVTGIDASRKMVFNAKRNFLSERFLVADLAKKLPFEKNYFDTIVCSMVLNDIQNPVSPLKEFSKVLKDDGKILITIPHPCFTYPVAKLHKGVTRRLLKKEAVMQIFNYEKARKVSVPLHGMKSSTNRYHRKIENYFDFFRKSGFEVLSIGEPVIKGKNNLDNIPMVMLFELRKK